MNIIAAPEIPAVQSALFCAQRSAEISAADDLYGWLVGSWELRVRNYWGDVSALNLKGEAHFGWVLEGHALQDVWIIPRPAERAKLPDPKRFSYGTTLRLWDPQARVWRVTWINPVAGTQVQLIGRRSGNDIVQIGPGPQGTPIRWIFSEISRDTFRWSGETLDADGQTWLLQGDFRAKRMQS